MRIYGVDFTCAPRRAKPITVARGRLRDADLLIEDIETIGDWAGFDALLAREGPWVGGFDFPFGLPRELVTALGWPTSWPELVRHYASLARSEIAAAFDAFRARRPQGSKYAHRAGDTASGAHSSMKLVNPPVALMLHAGAPRLLAAGVHLPAVHDGDHARIALEAYPGLLMRQVALAGGFARTPSYKNDSPARQTPARREARARLLAGITAGRHPLGVRVRLEPAIAVAAVEDPTGDTLDAIAAAAQAAWGAHRANTRFGIPAGADPLEGWIVSA
jgi:hypothetical protein